MLTLKQAMNVCHIQDDELVYLRPRGANRYAYDFYTGKQIRNKFDMKKVKVCGITVRFSWGEFSGMEFEVIF